MCNAKCKIEEEINNNEVRRWSVYTKDWELLLYLKNFSVGFSDLDPETWP